MVKLSGQLYKCEEKIAQGLVTSSFRNAQGIGDMSVRGGDRLTAQ